MRRFFKLLQQPSTWAGVAGVMAGIGVFNLSEDQWMQIGGAIGSVAGVIAMFVLDPADK